MTLTWSGIVVLACIILIFWGCIATLNRVRAAEANIRELVVFWWCQANPGKPLPEELGKRR